MANQAEKQRIRNSMATNQAIPLIQPGDETLHTLPSRKNRHSRDRRTQPAEQEVRDRWNLST